MTERVQPVSCHLTPEQIEHIRQALASMSIENMPVSEAMLQDAVDYLSGRKAEQEILDGIAKRAHHLNCDDKTSSQF